MSRNLSVIFMDQAYWLVAINAKPNHGIFGFIFGSLIWFALPMCFGTACGLAYLALELINGGPIVSAKEISMGIAPFVVIGSILGAPGQFMFLMILAMALITSGFVQIWAVASILLVDIYGVYIRVSWKYCRNQFTKMIW
ncbi:unnamed protein product [Protopolystoma xenopodis]|uniref:Uncharacterized protein n=1 Tax=Protopolystoma xenopodis TaxID=117903 RepID=A0A448WFU0_9PLAT|nr:unnamed protein product [Protopolystoma xenopodis]